MVSVKKQNRKAHGFAVIVPTRNRPSLLVELLRNLEASTLKPSIVLVVDSSDDSHVQEISSKNLNLEVIRTTIKSAAQQRNIGIDHIFEKYEKLGVSFISFLDDDVRVPTNYFEQITLLFQSHRDAVGISGFAKSESNSVGKRSRLSDFFGITGKPGELTKAVVNISPYGIDKLKEVDWLIGCSTWRRNSIESVRFEKDFWGHSIFEDVIFSVRVKSQGKLLFNPNIVLEHLLESENEGCQIEHYRDWMKNRYRIFEYSIPKLSKFWFWILTLVLLIDSLFRSIWSVKHFKKLIGLSKGSIAILRGSFLS